MVARLRGCEAARPCQITSMKQHASPGWAFSANRQQPSENDTLQVVEKTHTVLGAMAAWMARRIRTMRRYACPPGHHIIRVAGTVLKKNWLEDPAILARQTAILCHQFYHTPIFTSRVNMRSRHSRSSQAHNKE